MKNLENIVGCHIWKMCKLYIQDLKLSYMQPLCCQSFTATKILPNPKLEKERKNFIREVKQAIRLRFIGISSR